MVVEFDPHKNRENLRKHKLSLARAEDFDIGTATFIPDTRLDYGEERWFLLGFLDAQLHVLVATFLDENTLRAISLRKAEKSEYPLYVET